MLKSIEKENNNKYNYVIQNVNSFEIYEPCNPYGHVKEFMKLNKETKYEAHRVISPLAIKLFGIEEVYSVVDINGNAYKFDIFEDGDYRVSEVRKFKNVFKEATNDKYSKKDN